MAESLNAGKIKRLAVKVAAHQAQNAGVLRTAFDSLSGAVKLLAEVDTYKKDMVEGEINLLVRMIKRFREKMAEEAQTEAGALTMALKELTRAEKLLEQAKGRGYKVRAMEERARVDSSKLRQVHASVKLRAREAAFVLAELEQAADPLPGFKLASAAARRRHDEARAKAETAPKHVDVEPAGNAGTS